MSEIVSFTFQPSAPNRIPDWQHQNFLRVAASWANYPRNFLNTGNGHPELYFINMGSNPINTYDPTATYAVIDATRDKWIPSSTNLHMSFNFARAYVIYAVSQSNPGSMSIKRASNKELEYFKDYIDNTWDSVMKMNEPAKEILAEIKNYILNPANGVNLQRYEVLYNESDYIEGRGRYEEVIGEGVNYDMSQFLLNDWDRYKDLSKHENFLRLAARWAAAVMPDPDVERLNSPFQFHIINLNTAKPGVSGPKEGIMRVKQDYFETGEGHMNFARAYVVKAVAEQCPDFVTIEPLSLSKFGNLCQGHTWIPHMEMTESCAYILHEIKKLILAMGVCLEGKAIVWTPGQGASIDELNNNAEETDEKVEIDMRAFVLEGWDQY